MRFRARLSHLPDVGERIIVPGDGVVEEWDLTTGHSKSYVPRRVIASGPRVGIVMRVVNPDRGGQVDVILEDAPPHRATVGALITVMGVVPLLCQPRELSRLLDFLAGRRLLNEEQGAAVAVAAAPWLRQQFPDVARLWRWGGCPTYDTEAEYRALIDGVGAVLGTHRDVPPMPFTVDLPTPPPPTLRVRDDVVTRLIQRGRAN